MQKDLEYSVLTMPASTKKWAIVNSYLQLRQKVFIEQMAWSLQNKDGYEFEDYDSGPFAHYVVAHNGDEAIAGARLVNCSTEYQIDFGMRSYMIRDAVLGRIDLPKEMWNEGEPPVDDKSWELTRFVSVSKDPAIAKAILEVSFAYMRKHGGLRCLCLSSPPMLRLVRRYGFKTEARSKILGNKDGRFMTFECSLTERL